MVKELSTNGTERKKQICDNAIRLFLEHGIQKTGMREIARSSGITTGALYYYYQKKEDIVDMVVRSSINRIDEIRDYYKSLNDADIKEVIRKCIIKMLLLGQEYRFHILFVNSEFRYISHKMQVELQEIALQYITFFSHMLDEGVRAGVFELDNSRQIAFNIYALQIEWVVRGWLLGKDFKIQEYAEKQADFILKSISK